MTGGRAVRATNAAEDFGQTVWQIGHLHSKFQLKNFDTKTAHIPIIMITSRTAEKHRNYAKELGVDVYLGKPYQEEELLGHINSFIKAGAKLH